MFVCQNCGITTEAHVPSVLRVTETRPIVYPERPIQKLVRELPGGPLKKKWVTSHEGHGYEIVTEIRICPVCDMQMKE